MMFLCVEFVPSFMPRAVGIGSFNRVPNGPREQRSPACCPTRGALPTRLNECAILNRVRANASRSPVWFRPKLR